MQYLISYSLFSNLTLCYSGSSARLWSLKLFMHLKCYLQWWSLSREWNIRVISYHRLSVYNYLFFLRLKSLLVYLALGDFFPGLFKLCLDFFEIYSMCWRCQDFSLSSVKSESFPSLKTKTVTPLKNIALAVTTVLPTRHPLDHSFIVIDVIHHGSILTGKSRVSMIFSLIKKLDACRLEIEKLWHVKVIFKFGARAFWFT